ncbi:MAG: DNA/RNA non-specific endonuclease [Alistipes sp.]|nr:DNA/RNA non-specific endonuclease [Alistipes sp.]
MNKLFYTVLIALTITTFWACSEEDPWSPYQSKATLSHNTKGWDETTISLKTSGDVRYTWEAVIVEGYEWTSFSSSSEQIATTGKVGNNATIYFDKNDTTASRTATVFIKFSDGYNTTLSFSQLGKSENTTYDRAWGEQPAHTSGANLLHKTYYTTLSNGKFVRNYSICYDTEKLVSRWVAYPLHNCYVNPSISRTNAWSFDPTLPESIQQNIVEGGYNDGGNKQLDRGHMLPSASRYSTYETNAQTFYATNMMPQNSSFNQGVWGQLEGNVRKAICGDTLYVVVGTLFEDGKTFTSRGRNIARPSHCYKLLLRTKSGNTKKSISEITDASEIKAIGFLFTNESNAVSYQKAVVSIKEVEERSGFTFYQNLNPAIAESVKNQKNINDWNF